MLYLDDLFSSCQGCIHRGGGVLLQSYDFKPKLLRERKVEQLDGDGYYRVAWGYLKPDGLVKKHYGENKI